MRNRSSIFDIIGPVIVGPSSSHTSGVVRIARTAMRLLGDVPDQAVITFYNSFAHTYRGHASDRAAVGGLLGYKVDDLRIKSALEEAIKKRQLNYQFKTIKHALVYHPNTLSLAIGLGKKKVFLRGSSRGGGRVLIEQFQDFAINCTAAMPTLVVCARDVKGSVAHLSDVLSHNGCNIATMSVAREGKHKQACLVFEVDTALSNEALAYIRSLPWVDTLYFLDKEEALTSKRYGQKKRS